MKYFGHNQLKVWQMRVIQATVERRNTVIIHPTGSGKSICFQLPHLITGKATIVISPTISLMQDQTTRLQQKGIRASFLGTTQKDTSVLKQFINGKLDLLFVTVERLFAGGEVNTNFVTMAKEGKIGLIAVDEAHLFTVWKSFRYSHTLYNICKIKTTTHALCLIHLHPPYSDQIMLDYPGCLHYSLEYPSWLLPPPHHHLYVMRS